ncbi:MAG: NAD(P)H-dependent flavin oxidoreductase [Mycetocola sp.]
MTRLTRLLGIQHPVVLGAFGGLSSTALTARVSALGGLGSYGLYGYSAERIRATAAELSAATDAPYALNLWLPTGDEITPHWFTAVRGPAVQGSAVQGSAVQGSAVQGSAVQESTVQGSAGGGAAAGTAGHGTRNHPHSRVHPASAAVTELYAHLGVPVPELPDRFLPDFDEQLDAVIAARPAVLSVVFGVPSAAVIDRAHRAGITVMGTATTVAEAMALAEGGVDVVVASGAEAAGHRVSFLEAAEDSLVGTIALVPQIVDAVDVPVIAAGGIADRRGVAAAFALGAEGVQIGTAFLRTNQSAASAGYRSALAGATATDTVLTRAMSGRLARGIANTAIRTVESGGDIAPFPAQNWVTGGFRAEAARQDRPDLLSLWAGQAVALARHEDTDDVFAELTAGVPAHARS